MRQNLRAHRLGDDVEEEEEELENMWIPLAPELEEEEWTALPEIQAMQPEEEQEPVDSEEYDDFDETLPSPPDPFDDRREDPSFRVPTRRNVEGRRSPYPLRSRQGTTQPLGSRELEDDPGEPAE